MGDTPSSIAAAHRSALRLAATYAAFGVLWILVSDGLLQNVTLPGFLEAKIALLKGVFFVLATASLIYWLARSDLRRIFTAQEVLNRQKSRIREAYVDVFAAVSGGKLVLVTHEELKRHLGTLLGGPWQLSSGAELAEARSRIRHVGLTAGCSKDVISTTVSAAGEALNNALKHAGGGSYEVRRTGGALQVVVCDKGPGIDFKTLPQAVFVAGFSTAESLGMGFTLMLHMSERILVFTQPGSTKIALELPCDAL